MNKNTINSAFGFFIALIIACIVFGAVLFILQFLQTRDDAKINSLINCFNAGKSLVCSGHIVSNKNYTLRGDNKYFIANDGKAAVGLNSSTCE